VKQQRAMNAEEFMKFRRAQYEAYRKTPEYAKARAEVNKDSDRLSDQQTEDFLFQVTSEEYLSRIFEP
jgi:hypothetical protein